MANTLVSLFFWIGLCLLTGAVSGWLSRDGISGWYRTLRKPPLNPPDWVFGPVWTLLYLSMGVAAWMIWRDRRAPGADLALGIFFLQLALNFLWSVIFFRWQSPGLAMCDIFLLLATIGGTIIAFYGVRPVAGAILVPYLAWVLFASYLNIAVWWRNGEA